MSINLENKRVLVTGASRGIGFGIAEGFAEVGADLAILADDDTIHDAASELSKAYRRPVRSLVADISNKAAVATALAEISGLDVLVNNAGLELITPLTDPSEEVDATFARIIVFSKRPARMLEEVDIAAELGPDRTLELRDSERFFKLRTQVLKFVRAAAGHDN